MLHNSLGHTWFLHPTPSEFHLGRPSLLPPSPLTQQEIWWERDEKEEEAREHRGHLGQFICYSIIKNGRVLLMKLPYHNWTNVVFIFHFHCHLQDLIINTGNSSALCSIKTLIWIYLVPQLSSVNIIFNRPNFHKRPFKFFGKPEINLKHLVRLTCFF